MGETDLERFTAMLSRAGMPFHQEPYGRKLLPATMTVTVYAGELIRRDAGTYEVLGCRGFYTEFYFDAAGVLVNLGAYE